MSSRHKPQRGRLTKDASERVDDHILDVALKLFLKYGYANTAINDIVARCRISRATLYRRYPTKEGLFREVVKRRFTALMPNVLDDVKGHYGLEGLRAVGKAFLDVLEEPALVGMYRIVAVESQNFPEIAASTADFFGGGMLDRCAEFVREAQADGQCRKGDPGEIRDWFFWGLLGRPRQRTMVGERPFSSAAAHKAHEEFIWSLFLGGIAVD